MDENWTRQATGWGQCFKFPRSFDTGSVMTDRRAVWLVKAVPLVPQRTSLFLEYVEDDTKRVWLNTVLLINGRLDSSKGWRVILNCTTCTSTVNVLSMYMNDNKLHR